jgi:hypothetical protein
MFPVRNATGGRGKYTDTEIAMGGRRYFKFIAPTAGDFLHGTVDVMLRTTHHRPNDIAPRGTS